MRLVGRTWVLSAVAAAVSISACSESDASRAADSDASRAGDSAAAPLVDGGAGDAQAVDGGIVYRSQVAPITRVADAAPGVFIPPFDVCKDPKAGEPAGTSPGGQVCTHVMISGCTEEGRYFPDYADCSVVLRQRPYWPAAPAKVPSATDPRLNDAAYMADMAWVTSQAAASGCTCCHDARVAPMGASQWDISAGPLWLDTLSDSGLGLFTGLANSSVLGAYPRAENHNFDRDIVGLPSTDPARMQRLMLAELARRGLTEDFARNLKPFGGPIYDNSVRAATACDPGLGVTTGGDVLWTGGSARYVYVLDEGGQNPGVPPNFDLPKSTVWRLDVLASQKPLSSGVRYGTTPPGSYQTFPESTPAPQLVSGKRYVLFVQRDMALPITNCVFTYGAVTPAPDAGTVMSADDASIIADASSSDASADGAAGAICSQPGTDGDARGIGASCTVSGAAPTQCPCAADYCSKSPFDQSGYCTVTGCDKDPSVCPTGWDCFNVAAVSQRPSDPWICLKP